MNRVLEVDAHGEKGTGPKWATLREPDLLRSADRPIGANFWAGRIVERIRIRPFILKEARVPTPAAGARIL